MNNFKKKEILDALDDCRTYNFFLDLEHGYFYTAGNRINLFVDKDRWAIVFEKSGYGNRSGCGEIELNYFGNCLINLDGAGLNNMFVCNSKYLILITNEEFEKIEGDYELVSKDSKSILVRNTPLMIEQDNKKYEAKGIFTQDFDNPNNLIDYQSLIRYLDETNTEVFRANNDELRKCIPADIPYLMKIDEWHHRSFSEYAGDQPSSYETFNLIADVLVTGDLEKWKPTLEPNNDWRNWPDAGGL